MESKTLSRPDRLRAAHDKLQAAVVQMVSGDDWKRMLRVISRFHKYSFNNHLMIFMQRPDATVVAGFSKWKSLGRPVKKGEKGIAIFAPCKYKKTIPDENDNEDSVQEIRGFRIVHVFDISQTEGQPVPNIDQFRPKLIEGDVPDALWEALSSQAREMGFSVVRRRKYTENGYCDFELREIGVRPDVSPAQAIKTMIHEIGHALLHKDSRGIREVQEIEVESVAFIVCDALGIDSADYSFPYIAVWAKGDCDLLMTTAERVTRCATQILSGLEKGAPTQHRRRKERFRDPVGRG